MHELHGLKQARSRSERQIVVPAAAAGTASPFLEPDQPGIPQPDFGANRPVEREGEV